MMYYAIRIKQKNPLTGLIDYVEKFDYGMNGGYTVTCTTEYNSIYVFDNEDSASIICIALNQDSNYYIYELESGQDHDMNELSYDLATL